MSMITDNIDAIIEKNGIDRKAFFASVGITAQAYSQWRNEQNQPRLDKIFKIAEVLGCAPAAIFSEDIEKTAVSKDDDLMFALWGSDSGDMDEDDLQAVKDYAEFLRQKKRK